MILAGLEALRCVCGAFGGSQVQYMESEVIVWVTSEAFQKA